MHRTFDLVVIGGGTAGLAAARVARAFGARVALVERERIGGDCTWTGCIPSKTLLHAARLAHQAGNSATFGIDCDNVRVDFAQIMRQVHATIERVYAFESPQILEEEGLTVIHGAARFRDPHTLDVDGTLVRGRYVVICTGATPTPPPIPGIDSVAYLTSANVFDLHGLPRRLIVLGGGAIGVELAQGFRRLGSDVTLIEAGERLLGFADPAASEVIADTLQAEGIQVRLGDAVQRIAGVDGGVQITARGGAITGDRLLVATGRRPNTTGLDLDRAGVAMDAHAIIVGADLRTSRKHIFAAGDVTGGPQFTHYAGWQGAIAARNALLPRGSTGVLPAVPWVVFTDPSVAQAGLSESEARRQEGKVQVVYQRADRIDRAQTEGEHTGFIKLIAKPRGRLLGAVVVGSAAEETINELSLAVQRRMTLRDLAQTLHAYPTWGIGIQQASSDATVARLASGVSGRILRAFARRG